MPEREQQVAPGRSELGAPARVADAPHILDRAGHIRPPRSIRRLCFTLAVVPHVSAPLPGAISQAVLTRRCKSRKIERAISSAHPLICSSWRFSSSSMFI
jgi:hypothetical protein